MAGPRLASIGLVVTLSCATAMRIHGESTFAWSLPAGFPQPRVPDDNPMTSEKVALGRRLFYDARLSANERQSCASCHEQAKAFTDGRRTAIGSTGVVHRRNSMSLVNVAYASVLTWAAPSITTLEKQVFIPLFGDQPVELGMPKDGALLIERLREVPAYRQSFAAAFGGANPVTVGNVARAIASFERTLISARSPYDRFRSGRDEAAMSASARRGLQLFSGQTLNCARCHKGFTFSGAAEFDGRRDHRPEYFNIGLYNLPGRMSYPASDAGLFEVTHNADDIGKFKVPTLRNITVTAPYMHDGSVATLSDVLEHYATGGANNPGKSSFIKGFRMSPQDKQDLLAFLDALTDTEFLRDSSLSPPNGAIQPAAARDTPAP